MPGRPARHGNGATAAKYRPERPEFNPVGSRREPVEIQGAATVRGRSKVLQSLDEQRRVPGIPLEHDQASTVGKQVPGEVEEGRALPRPVRGIGEDQIERPVHRPPSQELQNRAFVKPTPGVQAERCRVLTQRDDCSRVGLGELGRSRPAAERLETQRSAAGVGVQNPSSLDLADENAEQRFARAVRGGSNGRVWRHPYSAPLLLARDDPQ